MRINVYHHELLQMSKRGPEHVEKIADTGIKFHAIRFYTEPPLMHQPGDDDSSAITFWVPWTKKGGHDPAALKAIGEALVKFANELNPLANARDSLLPFARMHEKP